MKMVIGPKASLNCKFLSYKWENTILYTIGIGPLQVKTTKPNNRQQNPNKEKKTNYLIPP